MSEFIDDIFSSKVVSSNSAETLSSSEQIVPDGFSALDFKEWWTPLLNEQKYNMAVSLFIPINNKNAYYATKIERIIYICTNRILKHSDVSITFRYDKKYHHLYEHDKKEGSYLNWFTKRPSNFDTVELINISIAFKRKDIDYRKFIDFVLSIYSVFYKNDYDVRLKLFREDKIENSINNCWTHFNFNDIANSMLDIKTLDIINFTNTYDTKQKAIRRLSTHHYKSLIQKKYELEGLNKWFEKWSNRYNNEFR